MNKIIVLICMICINTLSVQAQEHDHAHKDADQHQEHGGHEDEAASIKLDLNQIKQAGIQTVVVEHQVEKRVVTAPASVSFNGYHVADITALVDGVVDARHVRLGDQVKKGKRLVTLSSSALAQSQADFLRAEAAFRAAKLDLQRLEALVKEKIVSQSRFQQAQSSFLAAKANLAAAKASLSSYGMRNSDMDTLVNHETYGKLVLRAPSAGTVTADDFRLGQHIAAGSRLMQIVDESTVWVEVKLPQSQVSGVRIGGAARVTGKNSPAYPAKVIGIYHQLDQATRTAGVRLLVQNPDDALHPGMFVSAEIEIGQGEREVLLLPEQAVQRQGNERIVFVEEEPGHFERREVTVGKASMGMLPILQGVAEGERVVVKGAFVLASELAKSGFAVHNH